MSHWPRVACAPGILFIWGIPTVKNRLVFLVDGFNLYHAIDANPAYSSYKWLDLMKLAKNITPNSYVIQDLFYFTSLMRWQPDKMARHLLFIRALELTGVKVVYGEFRIRDRHCPKCDTVYPSREEKQTDVNIAITLFQLAIEDRFDAAIIVTGDSDIIPSIKAVRSTFPAKRIGVAIPIGRKAEELRNEANFHVKLKEKQFKTSMFPDEIPIGNGKVLKRPEKWR